MPVISLSEAESRFLTPNVDGEMNAAEKSLFVGRISCSDLSSREIAIQPIILELSSPGARGGFEVAQSAICVVSDGEHAMDGEFDIEAIVSPVRRLGTYRLKLLASNGMTLGEAQVAAKK